MKKLLFIFVLVLAFFVAVGCNAGEPGGAGAGAGTPADLSDTVSDVVSGAESDPDNGTSGAESKDSSGENAESDPNIPDETSEEQSEPDEVSTPAETSKPEETSKPDESQPDTSVVYDPVVKRPALSIPDIKGEAWDGTVAEGFASGMGTETDPFVIETAAQLAFFANSVNSGTSYEGQFICLGASIKLNEGTPSPENDSGYVKWVSIGTSKKRFMGTFDGKGYVVAGVYDKPLFGAVQGNIKNLGVVYSYVYNGGIVDAVLRDGAPDMPEISNCYFAEGTVVGAGGIANSVSGAKIDNCYNWGTVICEADWCGGIVGFANFSYVTNCYNGGTVKGESVLGGIIGNFATGQVSGCLNEGDVIGTFQSGGIIGNSMDGIYYRLVNAGKVTGKKSGAILVEMSNANPLDECYYLEGTAEKGSDIISSSEDFPQFAVSVTKDELAQLVE